jgi:hypothetical protein
MAPRGGDDRFIVHDENVRRRFFENTYLLLSSTYSVNRKRWRARIGTNSS